VGETEEETAYEGFQSPIEDFIHRNVYEETREKTFVDKVLNREEAKRLQELTKKEDLNRSELLELLYLLAGIELKLVNFDPYDRYLLGKFFAWIRDFVATTEILFDYIADLKEMEQKATGREKKELKEMINILERIKKLDLHNVKFLADIYMYLCRSTLSIDASAFDTLTTSRFEYHYPVPQAPREPERRFFWRR